MLLRKSFWRKFFYSNKAPASDRSVLIICYALQKTYYKEYRHIWIVTEANVNRWEVQIILPYNIKTTERPPLPLHVTETVRYSYI